MAVAVDVKVGSVVRGSATFTSQHGAVDPPAICAETVGSAASSERR